MKRMAAIFTAAFFVLSAGALEPLSLLQQKKDLKPPHGQASMPGPALSPDEALKKMTVPPGFQVELVASEPDLVNPVAMCFDEKGRIWITESIEYPRNSPGPGKDRVKVLESTKGDGHYDKVTVVIEGLNIPSGIAVGYGGVWVANSPDMLFYPFQDLAQRDLKLGKPEVVVTGFGRSDTHELPNSLIWGPDGWLYGFNGVFNPSNIKYRGKEYKFTCAMFRIHPRTRDFEVFCEGTSNPWGIAFDGEGSAFISACVIDHLWHLVQTGYYHRQGGPYPPFTWKIESIVKHKHQKAAYCGLCWFDSEAYPPEFREKLYMGNIHGGCINSDQLTRDGSTYLAKPRPDFLTANDAWFMPVAQKVGPDGCMYVLDWYDRYHCYQDAQRDPAGIDRLRGRLYRIRYKDSPLAPAIDLGLESDDQLTEKLSHSNIFFRDLARRLLTERLGNSEGDPRAATVDKLTKLVTDVKMPRKARLSALWTLVSARPLPAALHLQLIFDDDPTIRAWAVRAAANMHRVEEGVLNRLVSLVQDASPDVKLQWAIAAGRINGVDPMPTLLAVLRGAADDKLIPHIVWQNLHPLLEEGSGKFLDDLATHGINAQVAALLPRAVERMLAAPKNEPVVFANLLKTLVDKNEAQAAQRVVAMLADKARSGEIPSTKITAFRLAFQPVLRPLLQIGAESPLFQDAAIFAVSLRDVAGYAPVRQFFLDNNLPESQRIKALDALMAGGDEGVQGLVAEVLTDAKTYKPAFRAKVVSALGRVEGDWVAKLALDNYARMEPDMKVRTIELLTQRPQWSKALMGWIGDKKIPTSAVTANQVRKLQASKDKDLAALVLKNWGTVRDERNPQREKVVSEMRKLLGEKRGDPEAGKSLFVKHCAVCHKIYGEGQDVGPDITSNGRSDFDQLLSNVFDPNLVIGSGYLATVVTTLSGQVLQGLLVEDNAQRVVLKMQGGDVKTIARVDIDSVKQSKVSLMPEQFETQMTPPEIRDLMAFLTLDRPPGDPLAKLIPGTPR